jgi:integrase
MGRKRKSRRDLPQRVYFIHGAYYLFPKDRKPIHLGRDYPQAMAEWVKLIDRPATMNTLTAIMDRYLLEVAPKNAPRTHRDKVRDMQLLRSVFGHMRPEEITPPDVYAYMDGRGAPVRANREKALLSHVFSYAIRWGVAKDNPCRYVKRNPEARRERLPEPAELTAFKAVCPPFLAVYIDIKYMTGIRKGDMLKLRLDQHFTPDGIDLRISKNGKRMVYEWTPDLEDAVKRAKAIKRRVGSFYLFATRTGQPYSESGFDSIWQRYMRRALKDGVLKERFREHDIRASTASADKEHAQERLGQKNKSSTDAYIRSKNVTVVKPLPKNI